MKAEDFGRCLGEECPHPSHNDGVPKNPHTILHPKVVMTKTVEAPNKKLPRWFRRTLQRQNLREVEDAIDLLRAEGWTKEELMTQALMMQQPAENLH